MPLYLNYGDNADFLRPPFTSRWQERLRIFDLLLTELSNAAEKRGVPLTIAFVPQLAETALQASKSVPAGVDPDALPQALREITSRHGAAFVDTSRDLRKQQNPMLLYYRVDSHPSGAGQPIIAHQIAEHYLDARTGPCC